MKTKEILIGNEAIVQGALEEGVDFVSTYPGCPSAEIGDEFGKIAQNYGIYYEISTNEKVALEAAIGASFSGLKTLVAMKNFGLNVCSESLFPLCYTGVKAPMVIIVGDDPNCWSSAQSEQNSRGFSLMAYLPTLEPSNSSECREFTKLAFKISEKFKIPVMVRTTIRVAHQRGALSLDKIVKKKSKKGFFEKDFQRYVTLPPRVLEMKKELLEKMKKISAYLEKSKINFIENKGKKSDLGIITSGVSYSHAMEYLREEKLSIPLLKLGFFYPLPRKKIIDFLKNLKKVLIIEELDPYLEKEIKLIAMEEKINVEIIGKEVISEVGEINIERIEEAMSKILGKKLKKRKKEVLPRRTAKLCDGCPYWQAFPVIKKAIPDAIFGGDIGCNMMTGLPPHDMQDYLFCMGSSIGIAHGIKKSSKQKVISIMGDGTFFHSGISGLINASYNKSNPLMIILDNRITAMTGHQQNPGMGKDGMHQASVELDIEEIVKSLGVKNVKTTEDKEELERYIKEFSKKDEVSVIIFRKICALLEKRQKKTL